MYIEGVVIAGSIFISGYLFLLCYVCTKQQSIKKEEVNEPFINVYSV